jgi:hypothetical protein
MNQTSPFDQSKRELIAYMNDTTDHNRQQCYFNDTMLTKNNNNTTIQDFSLSYKTNKKSIFQPLKIENIFHFNNKIKFPKEKELWYLLNPDNIMYGPVSSKYIQDAYNVKMLDGNWKARLLDIFKFFDKPNYTFALLTFINYDIWGDLIEESDIMKYLPKDHSLDLTHINKIETSFNNNTFVNEIETKANSKPILNEVEEGWEETGKKIKKTKIDESIYLASIKQEKPKSKKIVSKIDIIPANELLNKLKPKNKKWIENDIKTNFKIASDLSIIKQDKQWKKH